MRATMPTRSVPERRGSTGVAVSNAATGRAFPITASFSRGNPAVAKRPAAAFERIATVDSTDAQYRDGRIAPASRLAKKFLDAIESGGSAQPEFAEGFRVQRLIDAARRSQQTGAWVDVAGADAAQELRA